MYILVLTKININLFRSVAGGTEKILHMTYLALGWMTAMLRVVDYLYVWLKSGSNFEEIMIRKI